MCLVSVFVLVSVSVGCCFAVSGRNNLRSATESNGDFQKPIPLQCAAQDVSSGYGELKEIKLVTHTFQFKLIRISRQEDNATLPNSLLKKNHILARG